MPACIVARQVGERIRPNDWFLDSGGTFVQITEGSRLYKYVGRRVAVENRIFPDNGKRQR